MGGAVIVSCPHFANSLHTSDLDHIALRPRKRGGLLGTGTGGGGGDERVKAGPRIPPEKDQRDRGPPPEQRKC